MGEKKTTVNGSGVATETRAKRGIETMLDKELPKRLEHRISKNTRISIAWSISFWQGWSQERNSHQSVDHLKDDVYVKVSLDIVYTSDRELKYWLGKYAM